MSSADFGFVPRLDKKTVVITGANSGIGFATAKVLADRGARVILAVRDEVKGRQAAAAIRGQSEVRKLDLAKLGSIRAFVDAWTGPIDILINNAGVTAATRSSTVDGFELQFGTNHLGPFALTNLLLPSITGRVVTVASQAGSMGKIPFDDLNWERTPYKEFRAYANSKLANLLFTAEVQRRLSRIGSRVIATAAHPGLVSTNIYKESTGMTRWMVRFAQSSEMGALGVLYAAVIDLPGNSFVGPKDFFHMHGAPELLKPVKAAQNEELAKRLWEVSEKLTGVVFQAEAILSRQRAFNL
jgi:Dehydrogenases with different specificities (related to short-chain alcohol dehydrogenases)